MTRYEYIKRYEEYLRQCAIAGLEISDYTSLKIYEDVSRLAAEGLKMQYCVDYAANKYEVSEPTIWRIIKRFKEEV